MDLNADLGEGFGAWSMGDDDALLEVVTSANVACGFHAGDPTIMRRVCTRAAALDVRVGAHVSYRDLAGFGRRFVAVAPDVLRDEITYQIAGLDGMARAVGTRVSYVKAHGALYNRAADDVEHAKALVAGVQAYAADLPLLALPDSVLLAVAQDAGAHVVLEGYPDRAYTEDGRLVPRSEPGAVLHDPAAIAAQAVELVAAGQVASLCVHGDNPAAVSAAQAVRAALEEAGLTLAAFT
jgi:5-oxoprolinase (ATP-hydrolysing) subunit A